MTDIIFVGHSDGSRSSYELQQRVLRRIPRAKRRRRPRRSEKLREQTQVLNVYSAPTFKSVDFKAMYHVSFLAHVRCRYTAGCARVGRSENVCRVHQRRSRERATRSGVLLLGRFRRRRQQEFRCRRYR